MPANERQVARQPLDIPHAFPHTLPHFCQVKDVILDHCCMVSSRHLDRMAAADWGCNEAAAGAVAGAGAAGGAADAGGATAGMAAGTAEVQAGAAAGVEAGAGKEICQEAGAGAVPNGTAAADSQRGLQQDGGAPGPSDRPCSNPSSNPSSNSAAGDGPSGDAGAAGAGSSNSADHAACNGGSSTPAAAAGAIAGGPGADSSDADANGSAVAASGNAAAGGIAAGGVTATAAAGEEATDGDGDVSIEEAGFAAQPVASSAGTKRPPLPVRPVLPWHFEQHQDEAVFIPGGCPHQVRMCGECVGVGARCLFKQEGTRCNSTFSSR